MIGCRPLETHEIAQALGYLQGSRIRQRNRCLFLLGLYSGFRISELLSLRIWDVAQYGKVLERVRVARRSMKGQHSSRTVSLSVKARKVLAAWLPILFRWRGALPDVYVFQSSKRGAITRQQAAVIMRDLAQRFNWPPVVGTHSLRKTFARSIHDDACKHWRPGRENPLWVTMHALGHASPETTAKYLGLAVAEVDRLTQALDFGV